MALTLVTGLIAGAIRPSAPKPKHADDLWIRDARGEATSIRDRNP